MKKCINCGDIKPIDQYYRHKQMKDGFLNKCKECCKTQSKESYCKLKEDPAWLAKERLRGRVKARKCKYNTSSESRQQVTQPAQERGNWRDLVKWLREIPGAPQLTKRRSIDCYCGEDKLFKPGESYELHNRRRIFIRSEVERVIREWAKIS